MGDSERMKGSYHRKSLNNSTPSYSRADSRGTSYHASRHREDRQEYREDQREYREDQREYREDRRDPQPSGSRHSSTKRHCDRDLQERSCKEAGNISNDSESFSFENYRYELGKVIFRDANLISDESDFWRFLKKYEAMQKLAAEKQKIDGGSFDKSKLISFTLVADGDELHSRLPPRERESGRWLSLEKIEQFRSVIILYLDFKQREKFLKLKKLRESQRNLPVAQYRDAIISAVANERVVIIAGDTGCGKSTQVPQYLLKAGYNSIACTQPRRIACISLSKRVAYETLNEFESEVGYQIRFERSKTHHTKIVFITEGLLLRQMSSDASLSAYDVVVLDEVHERHLHGDFLLGIVKCLMHQRQDLKVVLMSATINIQLFTDYFRQDAVVIQVPGRLFPISVNYCPVSIEDRSSKSARLNPAPYVRIMQLIDKKYPKTDKGDLLVFLSGMSEITAVVDAANAYSEQTQGWIVLPLHSTLSVADQDKVFDYPPDGVRKCIVSTNIAETSVTIDGIRFVADSGKVKEMSFDAGTKMQRLKEFWVSRASAEQRKGRAGRTGPGVCYRLYSEEEHAAMDRYSTPEIQRVPLDTLLLQMVAMGLPDARKFPFIEPPPEETIENSIRSLKQQGALTEEEKLTPMGRTLSRLPVDIGLGKMLVMGSLFHQVEPVLSLAAALSVQNPFTNRAYRDPECETSRKSLESDHGDPLTLLNAYKEWLEAKRNSSGGRDKTSRQWCRRRGLEEQRFYEMTKLRRQFRDLLQDSGLLQSAEDVRALSGPERALRHGEVQLLRSLKRSFRESEAGPRKRKTLKVDTWQAEEEPNDEPGDIDIRDVEFRLSNDSKQVQTLLAGATACSYKDLMMLKVILCSGLYPQLAIADDFNYCKAGDPLFHTRSKPGISLHPMGFFGNHPEMLRLDQSDIIEPTGLAGSTSRLTFSAKHQLLCYMSLLETTKPYLMTTMRMPAAQTLLLFAHAVDTNHDFSVIVCDGWLQLEFPVGETAALLLLKAATLRNNWDKLLALRLEDSVEGGLPSSGTSARLERDLSAALPAFMHTEVVYALTRLLAADIKLLYVGAEANAQPVEPNPFHPTWDSRPHEAKGGMQVTPTITYNCLATESKTNYNEYMEVPWHCSICDTDCHLNPMQRLQHRQSCKPGIDNAGANTQLTREEDQEEFLSRKPNSQAYHCDHCSKTLYLTGVDILRHKKEHT